MIEARILADEDEQHDPDAAPSRALSADVRLLTEILKFSSLLDRPMLDGVATPEHIGLNELRVLMSLAGEGSATGAELSRLLSVPPMNVSRAFALMERLGWLVEVRDPANRRRKPFKLSGKGWSALVNMAPEFQAVADFIFADLSNVERRLLEELVRRLGARVATWPKAPGDQGP